MAKPEIDETRGTDGEEVEGRAIKTAPCPFPSFLVLRGVTAGRSLKVLPVGLALTALDFAEELLDERFGFGFNCEHRETRELSWFQTSTELTGFIQTVRIQQSGNFTASEWEC